MTRSLLTTCALITFGLLNAASAAEWQLKTARVTKVIDGDTAWMLIDTPDGPVKEKIRILGLDTPEIRQAECDYERLFGKAARMRANQLLDGQTVTLRTKGQRGYYKRILAFVELPDGRKFDQVMIDDQLALKTEPSTWCTDTPFKLNKKDWP